MLLFCNAKKSCDQHHCKTWNIPGTGTLKFVSSVGKNCFPSPPPIIAKLFSVKNNAHYTQLNMVTDNFVLR
jgi:hypothetical protein